jgi:alpha-beta hydrolase superfamily lysophospholipase
MVERQGILAQIAAFVFVLAGGIFMFATMQRQLIYFPQVEAEESLLRLAGRMDLLDWRDDGGRLIGWHSQPAGGHTRRVVVFHGNAGYALHRDYYVDGFLARDQDWQVYLFEYPGYGARPGEPSESGIKAAATAAVQLLLDDSAEPLYLVGESLGSGVASYLAARFPMRIDGMLLVTPFTSLTDVAAHHYRFLPVRALLSERYDSVEALSQYGGPVGFLLAGSDEIVPPSLGKRLYDSYRGPRWLHIEPGAGHNSLSYSPSAQWWRDVSHFLTTDRTGSAGL